MDKNTLIDKAVGRIDVQYVEEALEPSGAETLERRPVFWKRPVILAAAVLFLCLMAGGIFAAIYFNDRAKDPEEPTGALAESTPSEETQKNYQIKLLSEGNAGEKTINLETDSSYGGSFESKTAPKEVTVTFQGRQYTGSYWMSQKYPGVGIIQDEYHFRDDKQAGEFYVNSADQQLLFIEIGWQNASDFQEYHSWEMSLPVLPKEKIEELAVGYAEEWTSLEEYSASFELRKGPTVLSPATEPTDPDLYDLVLTSMVQGIETTDRVFVLISDRGVLHYAGTESPGWVKDHREELLAFDVQAATEAAMAASHLTNPAVKVRRFGLDDQGHVMLMLFLTGAENETPLLLSVTEE